MSSKKSWWPVVALVSIFLLGIVTFGFLIERDRRLDAENQSEAVSNLLIGEPGVQGRACGILSPVAAEQIIPGKLAQRFTNMPVKNEINGDSGQLHWADSCRYVDSENSGRYVEMYIDTYSSEQAASRDFKEVLPKIDEIETLKTTEFDELYYSAGVWFARRDSVNIQVSAANAETGDVRSFSQVVFEQLAAEL